jgi:hypothetical protein
VSLPAFMQPFSVTYLGIQVWDEACGETKINRFGKSTAFRQVLMSWLDRVPFINAVGAYAGINVAFQPFYVPAISYPDAPGFLGFDSLETEGLATLPTGTTIGPNGMVGYGLARMRITFASPPYLEIDQGVLSIDFAIQDLELPTNINSYFFNGSSSTPVDSSQVPAQEATFTSFTWTKFNLASIPTSTIEAACATPIDNSGLFGTSVGNLRLMGVKTNRRMGQTGAEMWDQTVVLVNNPFGWNNVFFPHALGGTDTFTPISDHAGNPPFKLDTGGNIPALCGPSASF